jgi:hypothetical protein
MKNIAEKLCKLETAIKVGKTEYNAFGKYSFRNIEAICESVKPYLKELNLSLIMDDKIVYIGDRYYVEATVTLTCCDTGESISVKAQAREPLSKKGMDDSQITGTAASYARKRAMAGLLLLDNTQDADALNNHEEETKTITNNTEDDLL